MRIKSSLTVIVTIATILILSSSHAYADQYIWRGDRDLEWCQPLNWENKSSGVYPDGYPGDRNKNNDTATLDVCGIGPCEDMTLAKLTIENGGCVNINHELNITRLLTIENGGSLIINAGTVELSANNRRHKIGGDIVLSIACSTLKISGNASLDPFAPPGEAPLQYGTVKGLHNYASIAICNGKTLTNNITICGMMTIKSTNCGSTTAGGETASAADSKVSENISAEKLKKKLQKSYSKTTVKTALKTALNTALKTAVNTTVNTALKTEVNCALNTALKCSYKQTMRVAQKTTTSSVICDI